MEEQAKLVARAIDIECPIRVSRYIRRTGGQSTKSHGESRAVRLKAEGNVEESLSSRDGPAGRPFDEVSLWQANGTEAEWTRRKTRSETQGAKEEHS